MTDVQLAFGSLSNPITSFLALAKTDEDDDDEDEEQESEADLHFKELERRSELESDYYQNGDPFAD